LDTLNEIRAILFDIRQRELFNDSSIETVDDKDDMECKNEVFEELRELLGNEQAEKVADYFSGSLVYFSKNIAVARKHREIRKEFREGAVYRDLSAKYGYTETHIRRIVHKGGKNT
jgi:Mor family transcriptional regulator